MRRIALASALMAMLAVAALWSLRRPVPEDTGGFPEEERVARALLAAARSGSPEPAEPVPEGTSAWITLHVPGASDRTAGVSGGDVASAVARLKAPRPESPWPEGAVLQVDVEIPPPWTGTRAGPRGLGLDPGIDGARTEDGEVRMPGWFVERGMDRAAMAEWFRERGARSLRTVAFIEESPGGEARRLLRGALLPDPPLDAHRVLRACRLGGDYLAAHIRADGRYDYEYDVAEDEVGRGYNVLRHAGTTYSLYQLHRGTGDPRYRDAGDRAMAWLSRQVRPDPNHPERSYVVEGRKIKLGGAGLTLLAVAERLQASGDAPRPDLLEVGRSLARHIVSQQDGEGRFASFYAPTPRFEVPAQDSIYYPGEAILGLARFAAVDPESGGAWLDAAVRGADFLVHRRWRALGIEVRIPPDAWLLQALEVIDRTHPDPARRAYAFAIGRGMTRRMWMRPGSAPRAVLGAQGAHGFSSLISTGSRGEALGAAAALERRHLPGETAFLDAAKANAAYALRYQVDPGRLFLVALPSRSLGGIPESALDHDVRIDGVQHNLSGLLLLHSLLRDEDPR